MTATADIAGRNFNRWLIPPAALAVHLCIGMSYGFSVFWLPLTHAVGIACPKTTALAGLANALTTTGCDWTIVDLGWIFTLFFVFLGAASALFGGWMERAGPRRTGLAATALWCGGLGIAALGAQLHQLWLLWLGAGAIGGVGLGLGYISPVSTLIKWFPDRRGMATGMAIMGFGGGAMIGSPLANILIQHFAGAGSTGVPQTLAALAVLYAVFMTAGALLYRVPPPHWAPAGWVPPTQNPAILSRGFLTREDAIGTPQFWLLWIVLLLNVSASIGIIGVASPMLQEIFGGRLFHHADLAFASFTEADKKSAATVGAAFVGLLSLFNIAGRFLWASLSDRLGRGRTYSAFFLLGAALYGLALPVAANTASLTVFATCFCVVVSMYGGGFATIPAYLADIFGTRYVGAIHGVLLTAWSAAGVLGPQLVNYLAQSAPGQPRAEVYAQIFRVLAGLLVLGGVANLLIKPVPEHRLSHDATAPVQDPTPADTTSHQITPLLIASWLLVLLPLAWGVWKTLSKAAALFD